MAVLKVSSLFGQHTYTFISLQVLVQQIQQLVQTLLVKQAVPVF